ncbi:hypothetical protein H6F43_12980 [Leptolyngbya sp. FACHB-36]|nr:hypothetical protein [Leptolyngbya sp. FACHB-36]MBD2021094.1 hypothetical protein [Leptolyngbya sp. FACHB-36]
MAYFSSGRSPYCQERSLKLQKLIALPCSVQFWFTTELVINPKQYR